MSRLRWIAAIVTILVPACGDSPTHPESGTNPAAPVWEWQNPRPHNNLYRSMEFLSSGRLVAVSTSEITVSDDDGDTWRVTHSGDSYRRGRIGGNVLAVATDDRVLLSTDGGSSFDATSPHGIEALSAAFHDASTGVVVGRDGGIATTDDGGDTWTARPSGTVRALNDVAYLDAQTILIAAQDRLVFRSLDGGVTWSNLPISPFSGDLLSIDITAGVIRVTGTAAEVYVSSNGGADWTGYDVDTGDILSDISFVDEIVGVVVGGDGFVALTDDGGASWDRMAPEYADALYATTIGGGRVWAAGDGGQLYRSSDGGATWTPLRNGPLPYLLDVDFADRDNAIAVGLSEPIRGTAEIRCGILYTRDGGQTWSRGHAGPPADCEVPGLTSVSMLDVQRAVAVGYEGHVWTTIDGGANWTRRDAGTGDNLFSLDFADSQRGLVVGENGRKRITNDGGLTWSAGVAGTNTTEILMSVSMASRNVALAVGRNGTARRTVNGGQTWAIVGTGLSDIAMEGVVMFDDTTAVAIGRDGADGLVFRTIDGGNTWEPRQADIGTAEAISFVSATHGYITAYESRYLSATTDGGLTWDRIRLPTHNVLAAGGMDENLVTAVGRNGTILRMTRRP